MHLPDCLKVSIEWWSRSLKAYSVFTLLLRQLVELWFEWSSRVVRLNLDRSVAAYSIGHCDDWYRLPLFTQAIVWSYQGFQIHHTFRIIVLWARLIKTRSHCWGLVLLHLGQIWLSKIRDWLVGFKVASHQQLLENIRLMPVLCLYRSGMIHWLGIGECVSSSFNCWNSRWW